MSLVVNQRRDAFFEAGDALAVLAQNALDGFETAFDALETANDVIQTLVLNPTGAEDGGDERQRDLEDGEELRRDVHRFNCNRGKAA